MEGEQEQETEEKKETPQTDTEETQEETAETDESEEGEEKEGEAEEAIKDEGGEAKPPRDASWWEKRAKHFESEYKGERTKRQTYEKKYGRDGLAASLANNGNGKHSETEAAPKKIEDIDNAADFAAHILAEAKKQVKQELTQAQIQTRMVGSEREARKEFDGSDGRPTYDEMFEEHVKPFLAENPQAVQLLAMMPDPARAAYTLGLLMNPDLQEKEGKRLQAKAREDMTKNINKATEKAVTIKNGKAGVMKSGKKTSADYEAMSLSDFEKEIEAVKNQ